MTDPLAIVLGWLEAVLDALINTFGPFLVPAAVFLAGLIGYGVLLVLTRRYGSSPPKRRAPERRKD